MTVVGGTSAREQVAAYTAAHPSIQPHEAPFIVGGLLFQYRKVVTTADYSRHVWRKTKEEKDRKVSVKRRARARVRARVRVWVRAKLRVSAPPHRLVLAIDPPLTTPRSAIRTPHPRFPLPQGGEVRADA